MPPELRLRPGPRTVRIAHHLLPHAPWANRIVAWLGFVKHHGRRPTNRMLLNDYLFRLKTSPELTSLPRQIISDKEHCKALVDAAIGPGRTIPTLAVYRSPDAIRVEDLPADCVIKPTHLTGEVVLRRDGAPVDMDKVRGWYGMSLTRRHRETNYRHLVPKVIVEPIVFDAKMHELKIHCWKGRARIMSIVPYGDLTIERRTREWELVPITARSRKAPDPPNPRPACLDGIIAAADRLSEPFEYLRVDVYLSGDDFLIGELTNLHRNVSWRAVSIEEEELFSRHLFAEDYR